MKTPTLLSFAGMALIVIALNAPANGALPSPRSKNQQTKIAPAVSVDPNLLADSQSAFISPRGQGQAGTAVRPVETRDMAVGACALGSPKQVERTGKTASASCCAVTSMEMPTRSHWSG